VAQTHTELTRAMGWGAQTVLPSTGPYFVAAMRLIPAGGLLVAYAAYTGRKQPAGAMAWLAIAAFALVDGTMFQGFLALGLEKTSAGLGSVIIDSQPITVAILASLFLGETLSAVGIGGLAIGVLGLLLLVRAVYSCGFRWEADGSSAHTQPHTHTHQAACTDRPSPTTPRRRQHPPAPPLLRLAVLVQRRRRVDLPRHPLTTSRPRPATEPFSVVPRPRRSCRPRSRRTCWASPSTRRPWR
jgi:hypothetical protein